MVLPLLGCRPNTQPFCVEADRAGFIPTVLQSHPTIRKRRANCGQSGHLIQSPAGLAGPARILSTADHSALTTCERVNKPQSFFHLHLISDATGETLLAAGRAASAQYKDARAIEHIYPLIRTEKQLMKVFEDIEEEPGIVLYTVVDQALARRIDERCAAMGLPCVSVLEPVLTVFQSYLGTPAGRRVGAQHVLDAEYFRRIDALNFTMEHDDGQLPDDVEEADIVLIGISRTSKTPTSDLSRQSRHQDRQHPDRARRAGAGKPGQGEEAADRRADRHGRAHLAGAPEPGARHRPPASMPRSIPTAPRSPRN